MSHIRFDPDASIEDRILSVERYLHELQLHRDSRKGLDGIRGEKGDKGDAGVSNLPGPEGKPGKDADVSEVLELAISKVREEFAKEYKVLEHAILNQLKASQVVDENGKAHPSL